MTSTIQKGQFGGDLCHVQKLAVQIELAQARQERYGPANTALFARFIVDSIAVMDQSLQEAEIRNEFARYRTVQAIDALRSAFSVQGPSPTADRGRFAALGRGYRLLRASVSAQADRLPMGIPMARVAEAMLIVAISLGIMRVVLTLGIIELMVRMP